MSSSTDTANPATDAAKEELAAALDRLLRVAAIYGAHHPAIEQAAAPVLASVPRLAGFGKEVTLRLADDGKLEVAGVVLPATHGAAQRLRERLTRAGFHGIAFHASVSVADLGVLVERLRRRPRATDEGDAAAADTLPPTIRPLEAWYGIPELGSSSTRPFIEAIVVKAFEGRAISPLLLKEHSKVALEAFELMRGRALTTDAGGAGGTGGTAATGGDPVAGGSASASDAAVTLGTTSAAAATKPPRRSDGGAALRACVDALRVALESRAKNGDERVTLNDLLEEVREVLRKASGAGEACAVVEAVLETSGPFLVDRFPATEGTKSAGSGTTRHHVVDQEATNDVATALLETIGAAAALTAEDFRCVGEYVSIQLELLGSATDADLVRAIEGRLRSALEQEIDRELDAALTGFVGDQCKAGEVARLDRAFTFLSAELRLRKPARFARMLAAGLVVDEPRVDERVWPHVANELVLGLPADELAVERRLFDRLLRMPAELFTAGAARVAPLACIRAELDGSPRLLFAPPHAELRLLFLALVNLPEARSLGTLLLRSVRESPPALPGAAAFIAMRSYDDRSRRFLQSFLRQEGGAHDAGQLDRLAARTLVEQVARQPLEARGEPWVAQSILALGSLPSVEGDALLARVLSERRLVIFPTWPADCRRKAKEARERRGRAPSSRRAG